MNATDEEIPRAEIQRRMSETIRALEEAGPDPQNTIEAAPPRARRNHMLFIALGLVIALELAVLGVVSRMETFDAAPPVQKSVCESAIGVVESGLSQYRVANRRLPGTLEQLVPTYLPAVPRPGGSSLAYEPQGEGYVLRCTDAG